MNIHLAADHAGYELKEIIKKSLTDSGHMVTDHGALAYDEHDDYPDFVIPCTHAVSSDPETRGIILGGSGQGEAICANRHHGARALEFYGGNLDIVKIAREHNNANILSIGARFVTADEALQAVHIFLETDFSNEERHIRRIAKLYDQIV